MEIYCFECGATKEILLSEQEFRDYLLNQPDRLIAEIGDWKIIEDEGETIRVICPLCIMD